MVERDSLRLIKQGNTLAFKQLFNSYYPSICFYLMNFTTDRASAEDIAQTTFVDFWNKKQDIIIKTSLKSYLFKMAYNQFLMELRKKNKEVSVLEQLKYEALQNHESPSEKDFEDKSKRLQQIINQLPPKCQEILKLKMEGLTYKDISNTLNISVKTVESQMRIAFVKIKENFKTDLILFISIMD
ncbi:MAG: RNA polymerase sigma-70 factor [Flavobacteriaceae bacterium]|nr:RNA polymerase sigma-70 factor [Flavobacteriaceae bacterium]